MKRQSEGAADAKRVHFGLGAGLADERVIAWNPAIVAEAENLACLAVRILSRVGVRRHTASRCRQEQRAIATECKARRGSSALVRHEDVFRFGQCLAVPFGSRHRDRPALLVERFRVRR